MDTDTSEVGPVNEFHNNVAPCGLNKDATAAFDPGVSGAKPDVTTDLVIASLPSLLLSMPDTISKLGVVFSGSSFFGCISGTGPAILAPGVIFRSSLVTLSSRVSGILNSINA